MTRKLKTTVLDAAARAYAAMWLQPNGRGKVLRDMYDAAYKDEHDYLVQGFREHSGSAAVAEFEKLSRQVFKPRSVEVLEQELAKRLAVNLNGDHREDCIGYVQVGQRFIGKVMAEVEELWSIRRRKRSGLPVHAPGRNDRVTWRKEVSVFWPVYAGENEERLRPGGGVADNFPESALGFGVGAASMGLSNELAIAALDAGLDLLDEGTSTGVLKIYGDTRATDVDTAVGAQTLLGTLVLSDPAFLGAADQAPGAQAAADTITQDSSADATDTATWFRASASNDGAAALDDHIDGNVGTTGEDLNLNTVSIVAGAAISVSSWTVALSES